MFSFDKCSTCINRQGCDRPERDGCVCEAYQRDPKITNDTPQVV